MGEKLPNALAEIHTKATQMWRDGNNDPDVLARYLEEIVQIAAKEISTSRQGRWIKEPPKEPGYYWFRYPQMVPIYLEDNPTIVRMMKSDAFGMTCAFPGNDYCMRFDDPQLLAGDPEWWSEAIHPPEWTRLSSSHGADNPNQCTAVCAPSGACPGVAHWCTQDAGHEGLHTPSCGNRASADMPFGKAERQRAAGLRTIAKPGEPGYSELSGNPAALLPDLPGKQALVDLCNEPHTANLRERAEHD